MNYQQARLALAARGVPLSPLNCRTLLHAQGSNWTASGGSFYNGNGAPISNPGAYYSAVSRHVPAPRGPVGCAARAGRA